MQIGQQVTGNYCGFPISGVITARRPVTVKTDAVEFDIDLSEPVEVYGAVRTSVLVYAAFDGSTSSYTKHTDWLAAA